ncbi:hypothetical protein Csa_018758 [Cucumis sativus]|uniref:Uncharacterized protein n=1 Tax=Cucumis sativus TaxID=3659 RepID=A0A0A0LL63_CUCSA|nr:hypothetical protein Csa_018758 [Cucumis sativus]
MIRVALTLKASEVDPSTTIVIAKIIVKYQRRPSKSKVGDKPPSKSKPRVTKKIYQ